LSASDLSRWLASPAPAAEDRDAAIDRPHHRQRRLLLRHHLTAVDDERCQPLRAIPSSLYTASA
jgi:hypothetical protein